MSTLTDREREAERVRAAIALRDRLRPAAEPVVPALPAPRALPVVLYDEPIGPQPSDTPPRVFLRDIVETVAERYGVLIANIYSPSRHQRHVIPRWEAMYIAAALCPLTIKRLSQLLHRDHSTMLHGLHAFTRMHGLPHWQSERAPAVARYLLNREGTEIVL